MSAFCARWSDGSFSIVEAKDKTHALMLLDELGDEPAELWRLKSCLLDFELTETGQIRLQKFGEETGPEILERAYPLLSKALGEEEFSEHAITEGGEPLEYGPEGAEVLGKAVAGERNRLMNFQRTAAATERGKEVQRDIGGSGAYIDALVRQAAANRLRQYNKTLKVRTVLV